ncbi:uncharacterized protein [Drosophila bipectinata]|uniref:uncharacterized protein n=1 Tax=Drosophila bipectinata TaxID=42026 RepID=UPI001C8ADD45|nr:uncharacterized protein LOC108121567 [Drosophila bipectinata]
MKPSSLTCRIRQIWILSSWLRQEAAAAAAMLVVRRHQVQLKAEEDERRAAAEVADGSQYGVDSQGRMRAVRMLDDYIVPFECTL